MLIRRYNLAATFTAIIVVIVTAAAFVLPWHHHLMERRLISLDVALTTEEVYYLQGVTYWTGSSSRSYSYDTDPWSSTPVHSFMDKISVVVVLGLVSSLALAALAFLGFRRFALIAGIASLILSVCSVLFFFLWFGDAVPDGYNFEGFFSDKTTGDSIIITHEVWGPMSGWWFMIAAAVIQCFALLFVALSEGRVKTDPRIRPYRSLSSRP